LRSTPATGGVVVAQLICDGGQMRRPGLDRIGGVGLGVEHRSDVVGEVGQIVEVLPGVNGQRGGSLDEPGNLRAQPTEGRIGLVDHGLQIVVRYSLQTRIGRAQQGVDVRRHGTAGKRNDVNRPLAAGTPHGAAARRTVHPPPIDLWTSASTSEGMSIPDFSDSTASTPVSVKRTSCTRPTSVPR